MTDANIMMTNTLLADLRREREARQAGARPPSVPSSSLDEEPVLKKVKVEPPPAGAQVVDLLDSDSEEDGIDLSMSNAACDTDAAYAARLQAEFDAADASTLAVRLQQQEYAAASTGNTGAPSTSNADGDAPWPKELTWYEMQHKPRCCGNFDVCSNGSTMFQCVTRHHGELYRDSTAHGLLPRPMPGQKFVLKYMPHTDIGDPECALGVRNGPILLANGGERKVRPGLDGIERVVTALTPSFTPFTMPPFAGRVEPLSLGPHGETAFVLRNFDGRCGALIAERLERAFGLDVLDPPSGKGTDAKCAAAQGNNCQVNS
jgi:hypothetical protein